MRNLKGQFISDNSRYIALLELRCMFYEMKLKGEYYR